MRRPRLQHRRVVDEGRFRRLQRLLVQRCRRQSDQLSFQRRRDAPFEVGESRRSSGGRDLPVRRQLAQNARIDKVDDAGRIAPFFGIDHGVQLDVEPKRVQGPLKHRPVGDDDGPHRPLHLRIPQRLDGDLGADSGRISHGYPDQRAFGGRSKGI